MGDAFSVLFILSCFLAFQEQFEAEVNENMPTCCRKKGPLKQRCDLSTEVFNGGLHIQRTS